MKRLFRSAASSLKDQQKKEERTRRSQEIKDNKRKELAKKIDYWLSRHNLLSHLDITNKLSNMLYDKSFIWNKSVYNPATGNMKDTEMRGITDTHINTYLSDIIKVQETINKLDLETLNPELVNETWQAINDGDLSTPRDCLKRLEKDPTITQDTKSRAYKLNINSNMKFINQKYGIILHPDLIKIFKTVVDAAKTNISQFTSRNIHTPTTKTIEQAKKLLDEIINTCKNLLLSKDMNTPEGKKEYFSQVQDFFNQKVMPYLSDFNEAIDSLNDSGARPKGMAFPLWHSLDVPAKQFISQYKSECFNKENGKLSCFAIVLKDYDSKLNSLINNFHTKVSSYNIFDEDFDKAQQAYMDREVARQEGLNHIVDEISSWISNADNTAKSYGLNNSVFIFASPTFNNIVSNIRERINNALDLKDKGIYSGQQIKILLEDLTKMSLNKGVVRLTDFNKTYSDPTYNLFQE